MARNPALRSQHVPAVGRRGRCSVVCAAAALLVLAGAASLLASSPLSFCAPKGEQDLRAGGGRFVGHGIGVAGRKVVREASVVKDGSEGAAAAPSANSQYVTGIAWYLSHFVVSIGNDAIMKYLGNDLPAFQVVFLRFTAAALILLPVLLVKGKEAFKSANLFMHAVRGALLALGIGLWCRGLNTMPFASCVVINNVMPFFKMLFAMVILGEKVGKERWLASLGGFIGCIIVFNPTAATFQPESLLLLVSAMCFAMLDIFNKKYQATETITSMLFYGSLSTAAISGFKAIPTWVPVTTAQYGLIALLGVGANMLLFCLLRAFNYVEASATCPYRYTEFVLSAIAGFLFFAERPSPTTLLGSCIILPSVVYCAMVETRQNK
ncbi:unnamed protein product [Polarella glacialis]|uniref:EamA domain-containing protein n=1 Tax=Polarella glacialis TaxID=89957 RepID=A0A813JQC1_POLGL|nr:unnamed protein product [Polarella glacialis]